MTVLVLDGAHRSSLAIVRSLGRNGVSVHVGESYPKSLCTYSKYCTSSIEYSDPKHSGPEFIDDLTTILRSNSYEMVFASIGITTCLLSQNKAQLEEHTIIPFPNWDVMEQVTDKKITFDRAATSPISIPETHSPMDRAAATSVASRIDYPAVVKPRSKVTLRDGSFVTIRVTDTNYVESEEELLTAYDTIYKSTNIPPLIQDYIPGKAFGIELLRYDGEIKTAFMHERLREYPISGGASTYRKSIYNKEWLEPAVQLLNDLDWEGVAMVECKLDERTDTPKLIEINGRFWGSLPLAVASGADFPFDLYRVAKGEPVSLGGYRTNVHSRWLFPGDILWLISTLKDGNSKWNSLVEFALSNRSHYDILSLSDPYPAIGVARRSVRQLTDVVMGRKTLTGEDAM